MQIRVRLTAGLAELFRAPFLTIDGDPYPAVVDGRIKWILDG